MINGESAKHQKKLASADAILDCMPTADHNDRPYTSSGSAFRFDNDLFMIGEFMALMDSDHKPKNLSGTPEQEVLRMRIAVTGDYGMDVFTRYKAGCILGTEYYPEIAYDLDVPSGAGVLYRGLKRLLAEKPFDVDYIQPTIKSRIDEHDKHHQLTDSADQRVPSVSVHAGRKSSHGTLPQSLQFLHLFDSLKSRPVLRINRAAPLRFPAAPEDKINVTLDSPIDADFLAIYDSTPCWRGSRDAAKQLAMFCQRWKNSPVPRVFVILGQRVPQLVMNSGDRQLHISGASTPVWQTLFEYPDLVTIVCSATSLRQTGAAISRHLSWEQMVEDVIVDTQLHETIRCLTAFRHIIIRFGLAGALHISNGSTTKLTTAKRPSSVRELHGQLVFAPVTGKEVLRDESDIGRISGRNCAITAALLDMIQKCHIGNSAMEKTEQEKKEINGNLTDGKIASAIKAGLNIGISLFENGFRCTSEYMPGTKTYSHGNRNNIPDTNVKDLPPGEKFLDEYFTRGATFTGERKNDGFDHRAEDAVDVFNYDYMLSKGRIPSSRYLAHVIVPPQLFRERPEVGKAMNWEILRSQFLSGENGLSRINYGIAICKFGHEHVLNRSLNAETDSESMCGIKVEDVRRVLCLPECVLSANETEDDKPLDDEKKPGIPTPTLLTGEPIVHTIPNELPVPIVEFGNLVAIERDEIESFRSIRNLMRQYLVSNNRTPMSDRPLSMAVFGAPGSGKSFAVKEIAKSINRSLPDGFEKLEIIECNVAQFRSVEDLSQAITRIASINNQHKVPLAFFDEFDCAFESRPLGWLKYFLAPMQDGTFYGASQTISFGRAIFVFAGGVYHTISDFDPFSTSASTNNLEELSNERLRRKVYQEAKGPDFVSRLRGHINIRSINPDATAPKDDHGKPVKPVIRRALTLRGQIVQAKFVADHDRCKVASIDEDVLYALLTVDEYRHGTRSMEAILQMCTQIDGVIEKASLPPRAQLNMHVDAEEFLIRVQRGRFRSFLDSQQREVQNQETENQKDGVAHSSVNIEKSTASLSESNQSGQEVPAEQTQNASKPRVASTDDTTKVSDILTADEPPSEQSPSQAVSKPRLTEDQCHKTGNDENLQTQSDVGLEKEEDRGQSKGNSGDEPTGPENQD